MRTKAIFLIFLVLLGCNRPLTKEEEEAGKAVAATAAIIGIGYFLYTMGKNPGSSGNGWGSSSSSHSTCMRGDYQGCCSHHHGIHSCQNSKLLCKDHKSNQLFESDCKCLQENCIFD
jgi:hypothetical protein